MKDLLGSWKTCRYGQWFEFDVCSAHRSHAQAHKQSLTRKLQEREADLKAKQEQVAQAEQVRGVTVQ